MRLRWWRHSGECQQGALKSLDTSVALHLQAWGTSDPLLSLIPRHARSLELYGLGFRASLASLRNRPPGTSFCCLLRCAGGLRGNRLRSCRSRLSQSPLGGSWVVISKVTIIITHIRRLITPLITTPEPPSGLHRFSTS